MGRGMEKRGVGRRVGSEGNMTTATIEIKNDIALDLLQYLESINILRVLDKSNVIGKKKTLGDFSGFCQKKLVKN
jgi:hypothetical protein